MRSGEGLSGLSSAFLAAGVPTVMASHWRVGDRSTARLIERFYRELARGHSAAEALRLAQRALRADPATAHPFHWAGIGLIGDDARDLALPRQPFAPDRVAVYALVVCLALAAVFAVRAGWRTRRPRGAL